MHNSDSQSFSNEQLRARIAWYYFIAGITQQEISERLGVVRARINKIAGQMRTDGSVVIDIRLPLIECVALEEKLKTLFPLKRVSIVPFIEDDEQQRRMLGDAAGCLLNELLVDGMSVSIGWGRTLSVCIRQLRTRQLKNAAVVSLMGGLTKGSDTNTFEVSTELSKTLGADCYYMTAPIYCPSVESKEILLTHSGVNDVMERATRSDLAIVSCGDLTPRTQLTRITSVRERLDELREAGAIGELLGCFLDQEGTPVAHPLNDKLIALHPNNLKKIEERLLISGGLYKAATIHSILRGGYVNNLITDEAVAQWIIDQESKKTKA